jgi:hypothetical protein
MNRLFATELSSFYFPTLPNNKIAQLCGIPYKRRYRIIYVSLLQKKDACLLFFFATGKFEMRSSPRLMIALLAIEDTLYLDRLKFI